MSTSVIEQVTVDQNECQHVQNDYTTHGERMYVCICKCACMCV